MNEWHNAYQGIHPSYSLELGIERSHLRVIATSISMYTHLLIWELNGWTLRISFLENSQELFMAAKHGSDSWTHSRMSKMLCNLLSLKTNSCEIEIKFQNEVHENITFSFLEVLKRTLQNFSNSESWFHFVPYVETNAKNPNQKYDDIHWRREGMLYNRK